MISERIRYALGVLLAFSRCAKDAARVDSAAFRGLDATYGYLMKSTFPRHRSISQRPDNAKIEPEWPGSGPLPAPSEPAPSAEENPKVHNAGRTKLGRPSGPLGPPEASEDEVAPERKSGFLTVNLLLLSAKDWLGFSGGERFKGVCGNCFLGTGNAAARRKGNACQELANLRDLPRKVPACGACKLYWANDWPRRGDSQPH